MSDEKKTSENSGQKKAESPAKEPVPEAAKETAKDAPAADSASQPKAESGPEKPQGKKPKTKKPHRWRRRIKIAAWTIVLLFVVFRIAITFALPTVLNKVAGYYNLDCVYDRCTLSFFGGNVAIWHLRLIPRDQAGNHAKPGDAPLLSTEYIQGTIDPIKLLTGKLYVWRAEIDGANLSIERTRDGRIPVLANILAARSQSAAPAKAATTQPIDLEAPFKLEALRVEHLTAHLRDLSVTPPLDTTLNLGVRISDVGSLNQPMRFDVHLAVDGLLDSMDISGQRTGNTSNLDASLAIVIQGLKLKPAAGYLRPFGIRPVANNLTVQMKCALKATASTQPTTAPWVSATLALSDISVQADGKEAVGCDEIKIPVPHADANSAKVGKITISGVRVAAARLRDGTRQFAGLDLVSAPPEPAQTPANPPANPPTTASVSAAAPPNAPQSTPQTTPPAIPFKLTAEGFRLLDGKINFDDQSVSPAVDFAMLIDEISSKQISIDPNNPNSALDLSGTFSLPGLVRQIELSGKLRPFAPTKTVDVSVKAAGIRPDLLKPYLDAIGVQSLYHNGDFECSATCDATPRKSGGMTLNARLYNVKLSDTSQLMALDQVNLSGLSLAPDNLIRINSLEIDGPALSARREPDGAWSSLGFRVKGPATAAPLPVAAAAAPASENLAAAPSISPATTPIILPRIDIQKFAWKNVRVDLQDDTMHPATHLVLTDAGIELSDFLFDLSSKHPAQPGHVKLWLAAENVARRLTLDGTITPQAHAMSIDLNLDGQGLSGSLLAPYLSSLGIIPTLRDGNITATLTGQITKSPSGIDSSLAINKLRYTDGATVLASIDSLKLDNANLDGSNLTIGDIDLEQPTFRAVRDADGSLEFGGIRLHRTSPAAEQASDPPSPPPAQAAAAPAAASIASAAVAKLTKLHIHDASVIWEDHAVSPAVAASLITSVDLSNFVLGRRAQPSPLNVLLQIPGTLDELRISGSVLAAPDEQSAKLTLAAHGVKAGALASYLPSGMKLNVADGRLQLALDASVAANAAGGQAAKVSVDQFTWRDGTSNPLISFDRFTLTAPRIDPQGKIIALDELALSGLQTQLDLQPDGAMNLLGLTISTPPPAKPAAAAPAAPAAPPAPAPAAKGAAPISAQKLLAEAHKVLPLFTLQKLDLQVRRIAIHDLRHKGASPLSIDNLEFRNVEPIKWLGPDEMNLPPTKFSLTGRIDPLIDKLDVETTVSPFARQPRLDVDVAASGIHGDGVTKLMPELASQIDGQNLRDGRFAAHLKTTLIVQRRGSRLPDLSKGFDLDLNLKGIAFRAAPDGPVLLGLDDLQTSGVRYRPQTGVRIKTIELTKPIASALIDHDGLHVLGIVINVPGLAATAATNPSTHPTLAAATTHQLSPSPGVPEEGRGGGVPPGANAIAVAAPTTQSPFPLSPRPWYSGGGPGRGSSRAAGAEQIAPAAPTTQPAAQPSAPPAPPAVAVKPAQEFRIDRFSITGLDLRVEDHSVDPPMIVPLTGLDVDVRGLSNWLPYEDQPLRFTVLVNSGKVTLPKKQESIGGIPGMFGGLASAMGGSKEPAKTVYEQRDLFSEITAAGNVRLYPQLNGYIKASLDGLELTEFASEAKSRGGVTIGGGTFDASTDVRFPGDGSTNLHAKLIATDLSLSEPPHGPMQRLFKLPSPIDAAIKAVEAPDGSVTIPVSVTENKDKLSGIGSSVVNAVGSVMITALLNAPIKIAQGAAAIIGINLKFGKHIIPPPTTLPFPPGYAGLEPGDVTALAGVIDAMRRDKLLIITIRHDLGGGDLPILAERANPTPQEASALAYRLHAHEQELLRLRADISGQARALLSAGGDSAAAASIARLRDIDRDLAQTDSALDHVYDLLRPGANLQAPRRTRAASLEIGNQRMLAIESILQSAAIPNLDQRVHLVAVQFNPSEDKDGGMVRITFAIQKK